LTCAFAHGATGSLREFAIPHPSPLRSGLTSVSLRKINPKEAIVAATGALTQQAKKIETIESKIPSHQQQEREHINAETRKDGLPAADFGQMQQPVARQQHPG
jgi:hypothetical protein